MMKFMVLVVCSVFLFCCIIQCSTDHPAQWRSLFSEDQLRILYQNKVSSLHRTTDMNSASERYEGFASDPARRKNPRWADRTVRYYIPLEFDDLEETTIKYAIQSIICATNSCISFIEMNQSIHDIDHIIFKKHKNECKSDVGCIGGPQRIWLNYDCIATRGAVEHEIMHALGFYHEHQRRDRNSYISIHYENIKPELDGNFAAIRNMDTFGLEYDFESIMHYPANAFNIHNTSVDSGLHLSIIPHSRYAKKVPVKQAPVLSRLDVERIKRAYCPEQLAKQLCTLPTTVPTSPKPVTTSQNIKNNDNGTAAMETTRRPEDPSDYFPAFSSSPMTDRECDAIFDNKCAVFGRDRTSCVGQTKNVVIYCSDPSITSDNAHQLASLLASFSPSRSFQFSIEDGPQFSKHGFDKLRRQVIYLALWRCENSQTLSKLPDIGLTNMLVLSVHNCNNLQIRKDDFSKNSRLRVLLFAALSHDWMASRSHSVVNTTIADIEQGTFMNLPDLRLLSLEWNAIYNMPFSSLQSAQIYRFHCGCEYKWLREWFIQNPVVISPKEEGELFVLPDRKSFASTRTNIFIPIDCSKPKSNRPSLNTDQVTYSVNDNCES